MAKKLKNKSNFQKTNKTKKLISQHKLLFILLLMLAIPSVPFIYNKYKDWDNAQLIKGLAKDFPALVEEVEHATGLELDQRTDCSITTEKLGSGVRTCELSVSGTGDEESLVSAFQIFKNADKFPVRSLFQNGEGYNTSYRNKNSCSFRTQGRVYSTCITAVREANIELAREVFLNQ